MKKIFIVILLLITLTGCEKKGKPVENLEYLITYNSIDIKPGTLFQNLVATLEPYNNVREEPSTYTEGTAKVYEYDDFEIETYIDENNIEKIYAISITSEEQPTNEGIKIGENITQMKEIYGLDYTNPIDTVYIYKIENTSLSFITEDDIIIGIVYNLT